METTSILGDGAGQGVAVAKRVRWRKHAVRCEACRCERVFNRRRFAHRWHVVLTLGTGGVWGIVWAVAMIQHWRKHPWRCAWCGRERARYRGQKVQVVPELVEGWSI